MDIQTLSVQQLNAVKKQLDEEIEHLTTSFNKLRGAQNKFNACMISVKRGIAQEQAGQQNILVPLTASLYVPAKLATEGRLLVDIGTGFFIEKSAVDAEAFYRRKGEEIGKNMKDLEKVVQGKTTNLRTLEEVLRQKIIAQPDNESAAK